MIILKELNYRLDIVTAYDVLYILFHSGFVYENEILDKSNEYLRSIYNYAKKVLDKAIEDSNISEEYNVMQIAFSAIYLTRKLFGLDIQCRKHFKSIYGMNFSFYSSCVRAIEKLNPTYTQTAANPSKKIRKIKLLHTDNNKYVNSTVSTDASILPKVAPTNVRSFKSSKTINSMKGKIFLESSSKLKQGKDKI